VILSSSISQNGGFPVKASGTLIRVLPLLLVLLLCCQTGVRPSGEKRLRGQFRPVESSLVPFDLPAVSIARRDREPYLVRLEATLLYRDGPGTREELSSKKGAMHEIVREILAGKKKEELNSVEDYEALHREIMNRINITLDKGKIEKISFREFEVK
jgi:flagellar basal body-associated protein FliL